MLPKDEVEVQAEAFLGFAAKAENHGIALHWLFRRWVRSKDFFPEDARAILSSVKERRRDLATVGRWKGQG